MLRNSSCPDFVGIRNVCPDPAGSLHVLDADGGPAEGALPEERRRSKERPRSFLAGRGGGAGSDADASAAEPEAAAAAAEVAFLPVNFMRKDRVFDWSRLTLAGRLGVAGSAGGAGSAVSAGSG